MPITKHELDRFYHFASDQLSNGGGLSWTELLDLWHLHNPSESERAEIDACIRQALAEVDAGLSRPADEVMEEIRQEFGFAKE